MHYYFKEIQVLISGKFLLHCVFFSAGIMGLKATGTNFDMILVVGE